MDGAAPWGKEEGEGSEQGPARRRTSASPAPPPPPPRVFCCFFCVCVCFFFCFFRFIVATHGVGVSQSKVQQAHGCLFVCCTGFGAPLAYGVLGLRPLIAPVESAASFCARPPLACARCTRDARSSEAMGSPKLLRWTF